MKKYIKIIFAALTIMAGVSCANESLEPDASIDNKVATKTVHLTLSAKMATDDGVTKMGYTKQDGYTWKENDSLYVIALTYGDYVWTELNGNNRAWFHIKDGTISEDGKTAEFDGEISTVGDDDVVYLYLSYPYFQFPGYQYYVKDGWENNLVIGGVYGQLGVDDFSVTMKNAASFLCLNFTSKDNVTIKDIRLRAPESDGTKFITLTGWLDTIYPGDEGERPSFDFSTTSNTFTDVYLWCDRGRGDRPDGVTLSSEPTSFYISIPAREYPNGFYIELWNSDNELQYYRVMAGKSVTLEQNTIYNLPNLDVSASGFASTLFEIPDEALRNALLSGGYITLRSDGVTCRITDKGLSLDYFSVPSECTSLEGIKNFRNLSVLDARNSKVSDIDVSGMKIVSLNVAGNQYVKTIDASDTPLKYTVRIYDPDYFDIDFTEGFTCDGCTNLTDLNLSGCESLTKIECGESSSLVKLNMSGCKSLKELRCVASQLAVLELEDCTELESLAVGSDVLPELDLSGLTKLKTLGFMLSSLTSLNLTGLSILETLVLWNSTLLTELDLSGCGSLTQLQLENCPALAYINFSGCTSLENFDAGSLALAELNLSGCVNFKKLSGGESVGKINLSGTGIDDFGGWGTSYAATEIILDNCRNLTTIRLNECNNMTKLSLRGCSSLTMISSWYARSLEKIDLSSCTALTGLTFESSGLTDVDLSANSKLEKIQISNAPLTSLEILDKPNLTEIQCYGNENLENLVISNCPELKSLSCYECNLETLNLGSCTKLESLNCEQNWLTSLEIPSDCLTELYCYENMLGGTLDLTAFTKLESLYCNNNMLEGLLLPSSVSMLYCHTNKLSELDITGCPELMKDGDEDSFCVGKQRQNKVLTLHLTSQQNKYWLRTYSETDFNANVETDIQ